MKRLTLTLCAATLLLYACNNETKVESSNADTSSKTAAATDANDKVAVDPCAGQTPAAPPTMTKEDSLMMANWMAYATPGEAHAALAKHDGEWTGDITMWMADGAPPTKNTGTAMNKMIMGGRYQYSEHKGCFDGMPFEGVSITGYDNLKKKYVSTWYDNMGTGLMNMEGTWDGATKTMKMSGTCTNPMNGKTMKVREEFTVVDDNTQKMVMWGPDPKTGKEFKNMEIVLKRKA